MGSRGQTPKSLQQRLPKAVDPFLVDFENKRNEFLICGRLTSLRLFREGRMDEANKICDAVLGVDPEDIDTQDLKGDVEYFLAHPDELDLSKLQKVDIDPAQTESTSVTHRRLLRSFSDRRQTRRKAQLWGSSSNTTNGKASLNVTQNSPSSVKIDDEQDDVFEGGQPLTPVTRRGGLHRTQSESSKPVGTVLQKIQCYEEHARKSDGRRSSTKVDSKNSSSSPSRNGTSTEKAQPIAIKIEKKEISNGHSPAQHVSKSKSNEDKIVGSTSKSVNGASNTVTQFAKVSTPNKYSDAIDSPKAYTPPQIIWTELGRNVIQDLRDALEKEFFKSPLLISSCLANLDGDILGYTRGCKATKEEIQAVVTGMQRREFITSSKVMMGGRCYSCISATGHVFRARTGKFGINCTTFQKTIVICFYCHPVLPKPVGKLVSHIEKFVSEFGY